MTTEKKAIVPAISKTIAFFLKEPFGKATQGEKRLDMRILKKDDIAIGNPNVEEKAFKKFDHGLGNARGLKAFWGPAILLPTIQIARGSKRKGALGNGQGHL